MLSRLISARSTRVAAVGAIVATVLAIGAGSPLQAAPQSKTVTASCAGADDASKGLLAAFGGSLSLPFTVTSDVPAQLAPQAPDQPISFTWGVTISASVTSQVAAIDPTLTVKDISLDIGISGPTSTTEVQGRPAPVDIAITAGQPATVNMGPFAGTLKEIGKGGIIKYTPKKVALTISLDMAGKATDVKVECTAPSTVATSLVKIPGSPDIKQPIEIEGTANSSVLVDVLGKYVTPGTNEEGKVLPVDPASLKVVDGPGQIVSGQVQVNTGAPGSVSSVTFEVCSGSLPGTNEVQSLQLDPSADALKKGVALTLKMGEEETAPIWMVDPMWRGTYTPSKDTWLDNANNYIFTVHKLPDPLDIQIALERLPSIGGGGVKVTAGEGPGAYNIEFVGQNGEKDVESLAIGSYFSVFPQEVLASIIDAAKGMMNPGGGEGGEPGGPTLEEQIMLLEAKAQVQLASLDLAGWFATMQELVPLKLKQALSEIDVNATITWLTSLFSTPPVAATVTAGEEPIGICSQGVIDVTVATVESTSATSPAGAPTAVQGEQQLALAG